MEGGDEAGEVTLRIKSPSAALGDVEVRVGLDDCVLEVKRRIALVHQARPPPAAQKLVYLGKILGDEARLEEFLRLGDGGAFTLHLVLAPAPRPARSEPPELPEGLRHRPAAVQPLAEIPRAAVYTAPPQESMEEMMREFSAQYTAAMSSLPPAPSAAEMAAMQELYSQYLGLYLQYLGQQPAGQYQQLLGPAAPPGEEQVVVGPEQGGAPGGPAAGIVMNAGGGGAVAQEAAGGERHRDLLDWVYVLTRVMLLFSVIYFHSSFWRLAMVAGLGFLVFLYQARQEGRGRRVQAVPAPAAPAPPGLEEEQEEGEEAEEEDGEEGEEEEQPKPSRLAVAVTFLTSLISSIIPEQQQVV
jgi:hypothetical protein